MATYTLNESKIFLDIADGIAIVINSDSGIYYGFNAFGTTVLEFLAKGVDSDVILQKIKAIPGAPLDLDSHFASFVSELLKDELLITGPASDLPIQFDDQSVIADNFNMEVKSYADAQEMLLADPIHEVKEDMGWTPEKESIGYTKEERKEREKKMDQ